MRGKAVVFGVLALLLGIAAYFALRSEPTETVAEDSGPTRAERRRALVAKKMASRSDAHRSPVRATGVVVRAADRRPIPGAIVLLTPKSFEQGAGAAAGETPEPIVARTDAGGGWTLEGIRPGRYLLSATAKGFLPARRTDVVLAPGEGASGLELALAAGGHTLQGVVTDIGGGPIESAIVSVVRVDDGNLLRFDRAPAGVLTDADGHYQTQVPDGAFFVSATHSDYVMQQRSIHIDDSHRTQDFELVPAAVVEGVVRQRGSNEPVPGAIVVANAEATMSAAGGFQVGGVGQHRVVTNERGHFRMRGLASGVFQLSASARGAASRQPTDVAVGIAETRDDVVVLVDSAYTISGFAVDRTDHEKGLEGVWIGAFSMRPPGLFAATQPSESDGYFEIVGVQPGHYIVAAVGESALPNLMGTSADVEDGDVSDVVVEMDAGVTISGRIEPPTIAEVSLEVEAEEGGLGGVLSAMSNAFVRGRSDEGGAFVLHPVAQGKVTLVVQADDGRRGEVELEVGSEGVQDVVVELEERAAVRGRVINVDGDAVASAKVTVTPVKRKPGAMKMSFSINDNPMFGGGTPTRADGTFEVNGLDAGLYEVRVNAERGPALAWAEPVDPEHPTAPIEFEVAEKGITDLQLAVENCDGVITGVVLDEDGAPLADAWVTASQKGASSRMLDEYVRSRQRGGSDGETLEAEVPPKTKKKDEDGGEAAGAMGFSQWGAESPVLTDAQGRFSIRGLRDGTYAVRAELSGRGLRDRQLDVALGSDITLTLDPLAGIDGIVTADGTPVDQFTMRAEGPSPRGTTVYAPDGTFAVDRLDPGKYTIHIEADEGVARVEVEVGADARTEQTIELEPYATLRGRVVDESTGEPIAGMALLVSPEDGGVGTADGLSLLMGGGPRTGPDGKFEVSRVRPGKGTLAVLDCEATAGGVAMAKYEVEAGDDEDLGTLQGLTAGTVPTDERGDLGLKTTVRSWTDRPRMPVADDEDPPSVDEPADPERERLWVRSVSMKGPAYAAGIRPGDEVVSIDGRNVQSLGPQVAGGLLQAHRVAAGDTVAIEIDRNGSKDRITVEAEPREQS